MSTVRDQDDYFYLKVHQVLEAREKQAQQVARLKKIAYDEAYEAG